MLDQWRVQCPCQLPAGKEVGLLVANHTSPINSHNTPEIRRRRTCRPVKVGLRARRARLERQPLPRQRYHARRRRRVRPRDQPVGEHGNLFERNDASYTHNNCFEAQSPRNTCRRVIRSIWCIPTRRRPASRWLGTSMPGRPRCPSSRSMRRRSRSIAPAARPGLPLPLAPCGRRTGQNTIRLWPCLASTGDVRSRAAFNRLAEKVQSQRALEGSFYVYLK